MIPIATARTVERCLLALCGSRRPPEPSALAAQSFRAAYREVARGVPSRPEPVRRNIAAVIHCVQGDAARAIACLESSLVLDFSQYDFQALLADLLVHAGRWEAY